MSRFWRGNQRGSNRGSAGGVLARGTRRVGENLQLNIARSLPLQGTPQETSRMLLKMEKDVNARVLDFFGGEAELWMIASNRSCSTVHCWRNSIAVKAAARPPHSKKKNRLRWQLAVVDSRRLQLHCCDSRDCKRYHSGAGPRNLLGGRAAWASLFWSSSG